MDDKKPKSEENFAQVQITEDNKIVVGKTKKNLKMFDTFSNPEADTKADAFDLDNLVKNYQMVPFGVIDFKTSKKFQPRVSEESSSLSKLIPSIASAGILEPLLVTVSEDGTDLQCLNGFTRGMAIDALINKDSEKHGIDYSKLNNPKEFTYETLIPVYIFTTKEGKRISDDDCYRIASIANTVLEKWSPLDLANNFKNLLQKEVTNKLGKKLDNILIREHVESLFNATPLVILNGLMHSNILSMNDITVIKERVFAEIRRNTQFNDEEIRNYARLAEIPREFWPILTGQRNEWGIVISPKNAIALFFGKTGQVLSAENIKKRLALVSARTSPKAGVKKVSGADLRELKDTISDEDDSKQRVISRSEKEVAILLLHLYLTKGNLPVQDIVILLDKFQESKNLEDFVEVIRIKTGIQIPKVDKFRYYRNA